MVQGVRGRYLILDPKLRIQEQKAFGSGCRITSLQLELVADSW